MLVYAAMCADPLHHGHVNIIVRGRRLGSLTVGLLTDAAMTEYKRSPISTYANRRIVVASIRGVMGVMPQATLSYDENLRVLQPDYVIHGDDWRTGVQVDVRQRVIRLLRSWGGILIEVPYTEGVSSTQIIAKMKDTK